MPVRGKVVELQGYERRRWREFRTIRSNASGRFTTTLPVQGRVGGPALPGARAGAARSELSVLGRLLAGGPHPRAMSVARPAAGRRAGRAGRGAARAGRGRGAGGAGRAAGGAAGRRGRRRRPRRPRAGVGGGRRAAVAAAGAERDRRDRAHEPRPRAAGGGGARGGARRPRSATRTSSSISTTGARGSRHAHVEALLCALTGAEAALAVNNGAGAALLAAAALAGPGREVVVSRGQLVEIGGGFRVPDVIAQAGARLVEVGTTNRTRLADYQRALGPDTGAILRVHQSNFRQLGFVEDVAIEALCELERAGDRRRRLGRARRAVRRAAGAPVGRGRRRARLLLGRQAARRAAGGPARRVARAPSRPPARTRWPARCGSTSSRSPRWRRRCGSTATRPSRSRCSRCCTRPRETLDAPRPRARRADRRTPR